MRNQASSNKAGARGGLRAFFVASTNDSHLDTRKQNGFAQSHLSLSEEARNTERHHSWNSDLKLRNSRIAFVSAGTSTAEDLNPVIQKSENGSEATESSLQEKSRAPAKASGNQSPTYTTAPDKQMSDMTLSNLQSVPAPLVKSEEGFDPMSKQSSAERSLKNEEASNQVFFTDFVGTGEPVYTGLAPPTVRRSPSPTGSDSSGEIIIFTGRRHSCNKDDQKYTSDAESRVLNGQGTQNVSKPSEYRNSMAMVIDDPVNIRLERTKGSPKKGPPSFSPSNLERPPGHLNGVSGPTATKPGRRRRGNHPRKGTKEEGILGDYVANLREGGHLAAFVESSMLSQCDLGGSDTAEWHDEVRYRMTARAERDPLTNSEEWDSADLEDFDELSTSDEALDSIEQVLAKRERPSGVQYLVVGAGYIVDDARWLPISLLNIPGAEALIQEFEDEVELNLLLHGSDVSDASLTVDEQVAQDLQENLDDQGDEEDLEDRRKARMTDEQIARLLTKQEELGLGSDDLMLFDGRDGGTDSEDGLQFEGLWERAVTPAPSRSKSTKRPHSNFPSATAFADVLEQDPYNGFNAMDQQRPSLRKRPKGRREKTTLELSDSELEQSIQIAWEKDKTKKMLRKQEREELRAQGLLGRKSKFNMKAKYSEGISITEVKNEIRNFLVSSKESLALPPMAQGERKLVHEIANVFKLKSKSIGGGKSRFPILYRTSRTMQYNEETLQAAESVLSSRRFLPRMDKAKLKGTLTGRGRRGGAASAGISYRDGEVVGAAAPEIGQENRGRTMLEKMGWSTGTALGALNNNRGLVQPVEQVVKISRSGLG